MSKLETNTIDTVSGTTNLTIGSTNTSTITMPNGALSGQNYPAFHVFESTDQTGVSDNTWTTVQMDDVLFDTDSGFANDTYTIPSGKAGKYFFYAATRVLSASATNYLERSFIRIFRTRSGADTSMLQGGLDIRNNPAYQNSIKIQATFDCQAGDVYKLQGFGDVTSGNVTFANNSLQTYFGAFRIGA